MRNSCDHSPDTAAAPDAASRCSPSSRREPIGPPLAPSPVRTECQVCSEMAADRIHSAWFDRKGGSRGDQWNMVAECSNSANFGSFPWVDASGFQARGKPASPRPASRVCSCVSSMMGSEIPTPGQVLRPWPLLPRQTPGTRCGACLR